MRILGIDLGSSSIKAVELDTAFSRYEIYEYHEVTFEAGSDPDQNSFAAAQRLIASLPKRPDRIAITLRSNLTTFRNLKLPTRDKKAITTSVAFELDDDLPYPIENSTYDYSILSSAKGATGPQSTVHVTTTLNAHLGPILEKYKAADIDPDLVTTQAWAFRTLLNRMVTPEAQPRPIILVDIGHDRTTFYAHHKGQPITSRDVKWGGQDLAEALCRQHSISLPEAEQILKDNGFILPRSQREQATPEQTEFSHTLEQACVELFGSIRQILLSCRNLTQEIPAQILLTGGVSQLPGLARTIEEEFSIPTQLLRPLSALSTSGVRYSDHPDSVSTLAFGAALCLVGSDRNNLINLRKNNFAKQNAAGGIQIQNLKGPMLATLAIGACLIASSMVQRNYYKNKTTEVDELLQRNIRQFFGQVTSSALRTYQNSPSALRQAMNKELSKQRASAKLTSAHPRSPLSLLKTLSTSVDRSTVVDLMQFQAGSAPTAPYNSGEDTTVSLTFWLSDPLIADRLSQSLSSKISNLQRSKSEEITQGDGSKKTKITFTGKPTEDAYGK